MKQADDTRWHGYDALRALMMILGVFFQACYSYSVNFPGYVNDPGSSKAFDATLLILHAFRMPTFFAMAGFFTCLVIGKKGPENWLRDRTRRILLPFLVCYVFFTPLMTLLTGRLSGHASPGDLFAAVADMFVGKSQLYHFWFLYFLFSYSLIWYIFRKYAPQALLDADAHLSRSVQRHAGSPARLVLAGTLISFALMMNERSGFISYSPFLIPKIRVFVYFLFFFYAGTLMFRARNALHATYRAWPKMLLAAVPLAILYVVCVFSLQSGKASSWWWLADLSDTALCWVMLFGSTGFCLATFDTERKWIRRWADAGYWIYLVHYPLVLGMVKLLSGVQVPLILKFLLVVGTTIVIGYVSFLHLVRGRAIGRALFGNGDVVGRARPMPELSGMVS